MMHQDKKEMSEEVIQIPVGRWLYAIKHNIWMSVSIVLAIALIVSLFFAFRGGSGVVSGEKAASNLIDFINKQGNGVAELVSVEKKDGMYEVIVSFQGQNIPVFITLDGKNLVSNVVPLDGSAVADSGAGNAGTGSAVADVKVGDSPSIGNEKAKVTVIEFSDFSCPFCAAASGDNEKLSAYMKQNSPSWEPIVTNLLKDYVNTGKVRFSVKYSMGHSGGHPAQLVAWCLNEQKLYWKFYPKAFANQDDVEDLDKMKVLAKSVGADMNKLQTCLDSKKYDSQFDKEQNEGRAAGVQGTPAFFVNGRLVSGAAPYSQIKALVEQELNA